MKFKQMLPGLVLGMGLCSSASVFAAGSILFDPDGAPGGIPTVAVDAFDWVQSTMVAQGGTQAIRNWQTEFGVQAPPAGPPQSCVVQDCTMTVYNQAILGGITQGGAPVGGVPAFGTEYTMVMWFEEEVTNVTVDGVTSTATAQFDVLTGGEVYFAMYYDPDNTDGSAANPLTGFGYNDGTLILEGSAILNSSGNFEVQLGSSVDLDQTGDGDQYNGQQTVVSVDQGSGQATISIGNLVQDNNFFKNQFENFGFSFSNISLEVPFDTVNPSDCMVDTDGATVDGRAVGDSGLSNYGCVDVHTLATYGNQAPGTTAPDGFGFLPLVGPINGDVTNIDSIDFVAQTDTNSPVVAQDANVPIPGSLVLLGTGLSALGFFGGTRRRKTS